MKKIIIVNNNLDVGGVQTSLVNLIREISDLYDVTLLLFHKNDECAYSLPDGVKVLTVKSPFKYLGMSAAESKKKTSTRIGRLFWAIITKIFGRSFTVSLMSLFQRKLSGYDCAISYLHEAGQKIFYGGCNEFVLKNIKAEKKITWLHCDFALCGANSKRSKRIYESFDKIVACSEGAKRSFVGCIPELEERCVAIRNCNGYEAIKRNAEPAEKYNDGVLNVVTVARLSAEKGIDRMLRAVAAAKRAGYAINYHIVGSGIEEANLRALTLELGLESEVLFYGNRNNPYPYIVGADLFVLPSYHEAAPMVFDEAACLGVPVLATRTTSTDEMIIEARAGYVCENSQSGITEAFLGILSNYNQLKKISDELKERRFENSKSVKAFCGVIE